MIPKFRAWLKEENKMIEPSDILSISFKLCEMTPNYLYGFEKEKYDFYDLELMQSTGLKDKNNKEIFEGDIVLVLDSPYTVFYDNERGSYRLKPHDDRWNVDYMSNFSHSGNFEVVGNIYENKEYL